MTISRRHLYAAGEPLGECVTRREAGRIVCGGGDSDSQQATTNNDKRVVASNGIGVSGDGNRLQMTTISTDNGAVTAALGANVATVGRALDSVDQSNHLVADGFSRLISASTEVFDRGQAQIGQTQQMVADAWRSANTDGKGTIDNKTIVVLACAAAAVAGVALYAAKR